jgi:hypothetical protein
MIDVEYIATEDHYNAILDDVTKTIDDCVDNLTVISYSKGETLKSQILNLPHYAQKLIKMRSRSKQKFKDGDIVCLSGDTTPETAWMADVKFTVTHGGKVHKGNIIVSHRADILSLPQALFKLA